MTKFLRNCSLKVGDGVGDSIDLADLRIRFQITHGVVSGGPRTLKARAYNLSDSSVSMVQKCYNKTITLSVGYGDDSSAIFVGDIRQTSFGRESPTDTYLDILAVTKENWFATGVVSKTLAAGWKHADVQNEIATAAGLELGGTPEVPGSGVRPKVLYGMARDHMDASGGCVASFWSYDDQTINLISPSGKDSSAQSEGSYIVLKPDTGLIGTPFQTDGGVRATCLMNPKLKAGALVAIYSGNDSSHRTTITQEEVDTAWKGTNDSNISTDGSSVAGISPSGKYRVISTEHEGDTRGNTWYTTVICIGIDPTTGELIKTKSEAQLTALD